MPDARLIEEFVAPAGALALLARDLLADCADTAPDLSGAVVVLPNLHAASAVARALGAEAGRSLVLPRITTLALWAADQPSSARLTPAVVRETALFGALRARKWFEAPDLWPLTGELAALFDELTRHSVELPDSVQAFEQALEEAYQASAGEAMQLEARLVHELWHATSQLRDGALDAVAIYQLQLAQIARTATLPLYAVGLPELTPAERAFITAYAGRARVRTYRLDGRVRGASQSARFFANVWLQVVINEDVLHLRSTRFATACPSSPVKESLRIFGAAGLEQEARAVDVQVRLWLAEGRKKIAVVALDRLVARRARALLERAEIMVDDETGWTFSTTSASTIVMRWLDVISSDFFHQELLDLIKSPFIFATWDDRREAVFRLERIIRSKSVVAGLDAYRTAVAADKNDSSILAKELLQRLGAAARILRRDGLRTLHNWLALLFDSLAALDAHEGLKRDPAGLQLLDYLQRHARDLEGGAEQFSFGEWRQWLNRQLESAEFRDIGVSSPVIFTQLSLTRLRDFDGVVLTGCDTAHLPGADSESVFFNQSVRAQLGLPTNEHRIAQILDDLSGLLSRTTATLVTWQQLRGSEQNLLSPLFERINVFHRLAWASDLFDSELGLTIPRADVRAPIESPLPAVTRRPAPSVRERMIPGRISASGYNSLMACPYQYHARYVLGLREPEEVREALEKRDYGEYVHRILSQFHLRFPVCSDAAPADLDAALQEISARVFRGATEASYLSHAWKIRWQAIIPAYLEWQLAREQEGWRFHAGECKREIDVVLADGAVLMLEGRIDRIDKSVAPEGRTYTVLDYKTRAVDALRSAIKEAGEDVQLPVYVALLEEEVHEAFFLALDRSDARSVPLDAQTLAEAGQSIERLRNIFGRLRMGSPLPAQGIDATCRWCEMQGLCRKEYWA